MTVHLNNPVHSTLLYDFLFLNDCECVFADFACIFSALFNLYYAIDLKGFCEKRNLRLRDF